MLLFYETVKFRKSDVVDLWARNLCTRDEI